MHVICTLTSSTHKNKRRLPLMLCSYSLHPCRRQQSGAVVCRKELTRKTGPQHKSKKWVPPNSDAPASLLCPPSDRRMERRGAKEKETNSILIRKIPKSCNHSEEAALGFYLDKETTVKRSLPPGSMQQELKRHTSQKMHCSLYSPGHSMVHVGREGTSSVKKRFKANSARTLAPKAFLGSLFTD